MLYDYLNLYRLSKLYGYYKLIKLFDIDDINYYYNQYDGVVDNIVIGGELFCQLILKTLNSVIYDPNFKRKYFMFIMKRAPVPSFIRVKNMLARNPKENMQRLRILNEYMKRVPI